MSAGWMGWLLIAGFACSGSPSAERNARSAEPAQPTQAAPPAEASTADQLVASMTEYVSTLAAIPFTGDCVAWSNAALKVEPITLRIQEQMKVAAARSDRDAIKHDVQTRAPIAAEAALKAHGMTMADYEAYEQKLRATCRGNAEFEAAMRRIAR